MFQKYLVVASFAFLFSCQDDSDAPYMPVPDPLLDLPATPYDYTSLPANAPHAYNDNTPNDNPITNHGATLGRVLFYERALSADNRISCAACHKQQFSFADNVAHSRGVNGLTPRNSMHLVNVRHFLNAAMFWDFRAASLEEQTLMPIQDHLEMDLTLEQAVARLQAQPYYAQLFENAFGSPEITPDRISKALSQFIRSLNSYNSPFDRNEPRTAQEQLGFEKFFEVTNGEAVPTISSCNECHMGIQQIDYLPSGAPNLLHSAGMGGGGFDDEPMLMKVANIRNIELTAPYGHDGRYATLEELLQHHGNNLSAGDIPNLVAFLKTLTDESFVTDRRYSNPFRR